MIEANLLDCCDRLTDAVSMQAMDRRATEELGLPGLLLMENAARAVVDWVEQRYPNSRRICVCCGNGNNGGDGYAAARLLANRGYSVLVVYLREPSTPDAQQNFRLWQNFGPALTFPEPAAVQAIQEAEVVLDAIFGVGLFVLDFRSEKSQIGSSPCATFFKFTNIISISSQLPPIPTTFM